MYGEQVRTVLLAVVFIDNLIFARRLPQQVRYLTWEEGGSRHHQLQIDSENELMTHVSRAAIISCCSALNAWSQDRRRWGIDSEKDCDSRDRHTFVPYTVQNMLAEPLILITEDGSEYRIESQHWIELSYAQVWGRSSELSKYARDSNDKGINNMVCMQLASARQIFGSVSIELEQTVTFEIEPQSTETGTPALIMSSQLYRRNGQKFLRIFSMVSIRNCTQMPLASAILGAEDATPIPMAVIPSGGVVGVPLHLARDGIVLVKPIISGLEYDWCNVTTEAIRLHTVHDGTFRVTQMVNIFLKLFVSYVLLYAPTHSIAFCAGRLEISTNFWSSVARRYDSVALVSMCQ
jgi:hypothetical protein